MAIKEIFHVDLTTGKTSVKHKKVSKSDKGKKGGKKKTTAKAKPKKGGKG
tara:strand:+ start:418 stop:567 length:150 start_codon:yes stop_codon:yes gene_type:complete